MRELFARRQRFVARMVLLGCCLWAGVAALGAAPDAAKPHTMRVRNWKTLIMTYMGDQRKEIVDSQMVTNMNGLEYARLLIFRNSRCRVNLDMHYLNLPKMFEAKPGDNAEQLYLDDLKAMGVRENAYDLLYVTGNNVIGAFHRGRMLGASFSVGPACYGSGGCFQSVMEDDINVAYISGFYFIHELQHGIDFKLCEAAGHPEMLMGHPYADRAQSFFKGNYQAGDDWDWQGLIFEQFTAYDQVPGNTDTMLEMVDTDDDGVPDDDIRMPIDERRFGSDPTKKDTDGDGLDDMAELVGDRQRSANPRMKDSDGDGVDDGVDPYPTVAMASSLAYANAPPTIDGVKDAVYRPMETRLYAAMDPAMQGNVSLWGCWNEDGLGFFIHTWEKGTFELDIDGSPANGHWEGGDTYHIRIDDMANVAINGVPADPKLGVRAVWGKTGLECWIPPHLGQGSSAMSVTGSLLPADKTTGFHLKAGNQISLNSGIRYKFISAFKAWRMAAFTPYSAMITLQLAKAPTDRTYPHFDKASLVTNNPHPQVHVYGVAAADRVRILLPTGVSVGERVGNGPVTLTGLLPGAVGPAIETPLVAEACGVRSEPLRLTLDRVVAPPDATYTPAAGGLVDLDPDNANVDMSLLSVTGESGATLEVAVGKTPDAALRFTSIRCDAQGKAVITLPDRPTPGYWASYFKGDSITEPGEFLLTMISPRLEMNWGDKSPNAKVPVDNFSAFWVGFLTLAEDTAVTGTLNADDGSRLTIDDKPVLEWNWNGGKPGAPATTTVTRGTHRMQVQYYEITGGAAINLTLKRNKNGVMEDIPIYTLPPREPGSKLWVRQRDPVGNISAWTGIPFHN